jgi:uncharacterized lipoprotein YddW (UPF0748 family)
MFPPSSLFQDHGDVLAECLEACRGSGIQVHAWVILWKLGRSHDWYVQQMTDQGRVQVSSTGEASEWLCPSDPDNRELMFTLVREIATGYGPDGIQLDYIRYPNTRHCFCSGCRSRFEAAETIRVACWPDQVLPGGSLHGLWMDWRTETITSFVREVRRMLREEAPAVLLSAAVLPDVDDAMGNGQDWASWAEEGLVDFLCPMDYTDSLEEFSDYLDIQMALVDGLPLVAGIGVLSTGQDLTPEQVSRQIAAAREAGTAGWALYHLNLQMRRDKLPFLDFSE